MIKKCGKGCINIWKNVINKISGTDDQGYWPSRPLTWTIKIRTNT